MCMRDANSGSAGTAGRGRQLELEGFLGSRYLCCVHLNWHHLSKWANVSWEGEVLEIRSVEGEVERLRCA